MVSLSDTVERPLWTAEEFLQWLKPEVRADLIDGARHMHSPVSLRHARLLNFVHCLMSLYLEQRKLGEVHREVFAVRLASRQVFMPDLCYFTPEQVARLEPTFAPFAPTLVVEAISPGKADLDTGPKFAAYEEHGVREYWILDPERLAHRFYRREGELLVEFAAGSGWILAQTVPGFRVNRAWLNPQKLPPVNPCLAEIVASSD